MAAISGTDDIEMLRDREARNRAQVRAWLYGVLVVLFALVRSEEQPIRSHRPELLFP